MRTIVGVMVLLTLGASLALAQTEPKPKPGTSMPRRERPQSPVVPGGVDVEGRFTVGEEAPDFELTSSRDRQVRLVRQRGDWIILVFAEGRGEFTALKPIHEPLAKLGARILGVSKDNPQSLRTHAQREGIPFEMLADPTGEVSAMYGLYDSVRSRTVPGFLVLDRRGIVRLAVSGQALPPGQVIELVRFTITSPQAENARP